MKCSYNVVCGADVQSLNTWRKFQYRVRCEAFSRKDLLPSKRTQFPHHLRRQIPTCGHASGLADRVVDFAKILFRGVVEHTGRLRVQRGPNVCLPVFANRGEIATKGLDHVVDIKNVLGAPVAITLFVNQNLLHQECRRVGNKDASNAGRRIARGRGDHHVPGILEQQFEVTELLD